MDVMNKYKILISILIISIFPAFSQSLPPNDWIWEYHNYYCRYPMSKATIDILSYSIGYQVDSSLYIWEPMNDWSERWEQKDGYSPWECVGNFPIELRKKSVYEKDNRVYLVLQPDDFKEQSLWRYNEITDNLEEYKFDEPFDAVLYDFNLEAGDRYLTLLNGNILTMATVLDAVCVTEIFGRVKKITAVTNYPLGHLNFDELDSRDFDRYTLRYEEKIGNIGYGTYTSLEYGYDGNTGLIEDYTCLNKVYDSTGRVLYQGKGIDGFSNIPEISENTGYADIEIYDLYGCRAISPQPGSVYIRNGKKFVRR